MVFRSLIRIFARKITKTDMKKYIIIGIVFFVAFSVQAIGQTKVELLKDIRKQYATAKEKIAQNGKGGKSAKDMHIVLNSLSDEEIPLYETMTLKFFFDEIMSDGIAVKHPYFIVEDWSLHGHLRYREVLLDPKSQKVVFCYMRGETDGGFVVESRYYYNAQGMCFEEKHNTPNTWTTANSEKENAEGYLKIFNMVNYNGYFTPLDIDGENKPTMPKTQRMKYIRTLYGAAKSKIAENNKKEMSDDLQITIHDQGDDRPPLTRNINIYFDNDGCYFISRRSKSMMSEGYDEYLFDPKTHDLVFSFTQGKEEGQVFEWRYYYDENGNCIETKSNSEETDGGFYDKRAAKDLLAIFCELTKEE